MGVVWVGLGQKSPLWWGYRRRNTVVIVFYPIWFSFMLIAGHRYFCNPHRLLPAPGESSRCKWQVAKAKGIMTYKHKNPLPPAVVKVVTPLFEQLSDKTLLATTKDCLTQNPNEGCKKCDLHWLHIKMWDHVPGCSLVPRPCQKYWKTGLVTHAKHSRICCVSNLWLEQMNHVTSWTNVNVVALFHSPPPSLPPSLPFLPPSFLLSSSLPHQVMCPRGRPRSFAVTDLSWNWNMPPQNSLDLQCGENDFIWLSLHQNRLVGQVKNALQIFPGTETCMHKSQTTSKMFEMAVSDLGAFFLQKLIPAAKNGNMLSVKEHLFSCALRR